jgi:hypothetical protein
MNIKIIKIIAVFHIEKSETESDIVIPIEQLRYKGNNS